MTRSENTYNTISNLHNPGCAVIRRLLLGTVLLFTSVASNAAILQYEAGEGSQLTGALEVNVPGFGLYNVEFVEAFCNVFGQCSFFLEPVIDFVNFPVDNGSDAELFSLALLQDIFQAPSTPVEYNLEPYLTRGCEDFNECNIITPYDAFEVDTFCTIFLINCGVFLKSSTFTNSAISQNQINDTTYELPFSSSERSKYVFAKWTDPTAINPVPVPAALWLFISGIFTLTLPYLARQKKIV